MLVKNQHKNVLKDTPDPAHINGSQLAKMESTFLTCHCNEICREEAVGLKKFR